MWNMFACLKKMCSFFCLDSTSMLVLAERLGSLKTYLPAISSGEEKSFQEYRLFWFIPYVCMYIGKGLHLYFVLANGKTLTVQLLHWRSTCACFSVYCSLFTWAESRILLFSWFCCIWMCCMKPLESHENQLFLSPRYGEKAVQKHSAFH